MTNFYSCILGAGGGVGGSSSSDAGLGGNTIGASEGNAKLLYHAFIAVIQIIVH